MPMSSDATRATTRREPIPLVLILTEELFTEASIQNRNANQSCKRKLWRFDSRLLRSACRSGLDQAAEPQIAPDGGAFAVCPCVCE